jgi:hypothetical protein
MTRTTNARLAGFTFLFYIATGITSMVLSARATVGEGTAAKLASMAQHAGTVRVTLVLTLLMMIDAFVLAVTLYALTRDEDQDLAMLALTFRICEGVLGAISVFVTLGLLSVAKAAAGAAAFDVGAANALGAVLLKVDGWGPLVGGWVFAVGSTLFCYLFLRARTIPVALAWLGVVGSILLVVALPLQLTRLITSPVTDVIWLPMLVFEVTFGLWLLIKGWPAQQAH